MANNPNTNKLRREFEHEEAWWNAPTEEQKQAQREIMTEHARNKDKSAAWEALPKEDRDTGHRVNDALSKVESAHNRAIQAAKSALEQAERRAKSLTGIK
ncbi:hypothetical protein ABID65_008504 [Bradyrhizobium sp. S3.9.2]|uniref:hypothetical protein n=1 Tax=Bradyrhizobium sp. S3.9.2 TaxID=3156432 RepID=UPI00339A0458